MKKKRNLKGFTLVEIIITVAIISIIFAIAGTIIFNTIKNSKEKSLEITKNNILKSARIYAEENTDIAWIDKTYLPNPPEDEKKSFICISVNELVNKDLLKKDVANNISEKEKNIIIWKNEDNTIATETFDENNNCSNENMIDIPTKDICLTPTPTYNGGEQKLTKIDDVANIYDNLSIESNEKATDAGTYEVKFKLKNDALHWSDGTGNTNNDGTENTKSVNCSIKKATPTLAINPKYTENTEVLTNYTTKLTSNVPGTIVLKVSNPDYYEATIVGEDKISYGVEKEINIRALSSRNIEGTVTITLIPDDKNNYYNTSTTYTIYKPVPVTKLKTVNVPICYDITYDGTPQDLLPNSEAYSLNYNLEKSNIPTEIGDYKITATLNYGYKWNDETTEPKDITCSIKEANYTEANYTVRYNSNNGTGSMSNDTATYMKDFTPAENQFTREGYHFKNWNENAWGMGTVWNSQETKNYAYKSDMTLYAQWIANTYTIKYDGNGNTGGSTADSTHTYGTSKVLTTNGFSKTGYTFNGWNTNPNGTGNSYSNRQSVVNLTTKNNETITLYAQWIADEIEETPKTYTIIYNANGGTGAPGNQTKTHDVTLKLSNNKPTKYNNNSNGYTVTFDANGGNCSTPSLRATNTTSYTFSKWNTKADGTGTAYSSGGNYTKNENATLYAQWTTSTTKGSISLPSANRLGYTFKGWATSSNATTGITGNYTPASNVTLYAIWTKTFGEQGQPENPTTYTITYDANGGTGAPSQQIKYHDKTLTLSGAKPVRSNNYDMGYTVTFDANGGSCSTTSLTATNTINFTFSKWNTKANGTGTAYSSNGSYTANSSATLYAQWTNSTTNGSITLPTATRSGYTFKGWATSSSASSGITGNYTPTSNVTLYAIWTATPTEEEPLATYTITYNANGGTGAPSAQIKNHGTTLRLSGTLPTRAQETVNGYKVTFNANEGSCSTSSLTAKNIITYSFLNWNTTSNGSGTPYPPNGNYTTDSSATLYAQWTPTTNKGGIILPTATRSGYTFKGWATSKNATTGVTGSYTPTSNITLYAVWEKNQVNTYTITYDANKGSGAPSAQTKEQDKALTLSTTKPTRSNDTSNGFTVTFNANGGSCSKSSLSSEKTNKYTFKNWNTKVDGTGTSYNSGGSYTANSSTTLYAQWTTNTTNGSITLPTATRTGYTFKGWATSSSATSGSTGTYTPTSNVTLYAIWTANVVTIKFNTNGGSITSKTTNSGTTYNWTTSSSGTIKLNNAELIQQVSYNSSLPSNGLNNYNNSNYINITKDGYAAKDGYEWICLSGCSTANKTFSQSKAYNASEFCNASNGNCTVELGVNWSEEITTINGTRYQCLEIKNNYRLSIFNITTCTSSTCNFNKLNGLTSSTIDKSMIISFDEFAENDKPFYIASWTVPRNKLTPQIADNCKSTRYVKTSSGNGLNCRNAADPDATRVSGVAECAKITAYRTTTKVDNNGNNWFYFPGADCYLSGQYLYSSQQCSSGSGSSSGSSSGGSTSSNPVMCGKCSSDSDCGSSMTCSATCGAGYSCCVAKQNASQGIMCN